MRSLWEPSRPRGECGKSAVRGVAIGTLVGLALVAASLLGLI